MTRGALHMGRQTRKAKGDDESKEKHFPPILHSALRFSYQKTIGACAWLLKVQRQRNVSLCKYLGQAIPKKERTQVVLTVPIFVTTFNSSCFLLSWLPLSLDIPHSWFSSFGPPTQPSAPLHLTVQQPRNSNSLHSLDRVPVQNTLPQSYFTALGPALQGKGNLQGRGNAA